jgi:hypothetical protein
MDRFEAKYIPEPNSGCWLWIAAIDPQNGYGRFGDWQDGRTRSFWAHRLSYELYVGPIPDGLVIDHLCRTRCCVNPDHLEPVLHLTNVLRGECGKKRERTHCSRGHEYTDVTTAWLTSPKGRKWRRCRRCLAENSLKSYNNVGRGTRMTREGKAA